MASALAAAGLVAISLAVAGVALVVLQDRAVRATVQEQVEAETALVGERLERGESPEDAVDAGSGGFAVVQVLDVGGVVLAASPQLVGAPPMRSGEPARPVADIDDAGLDVDDGPLLVVPLGVDTPAGQRLVLAGGSLTAAEQSVRSAARLALLGVPLLALVTGAATDAVTGRARRRVVDTRAGVAELPAGAVGGGGAEPAAHDEIGRLARTMNDMLARLEAAQGAQRRFVADASHELRSPLASILARLELAGRRGPTEQDVAVMLPEARRMATLIEGLLLLARADERGLVPRRDEIDLDEVVESEVGRHHGGRVRVRGRTVPVRVMGDRGQLVRVVSNLVDNAVRHASAEVVVRLRQEGRWGVIEVSDDGPGIPVGDRARVFERFVRLDEGRARDDGGTGLGLAIVAEVVAAHRGRVEVGDAPGGGAAVTVVLPAQAVPASSPAGSPRNR